MIPTKKLYESVDLASYDAIKSIDLASIYPNYYQLPVKERWKFLLNKFSSKLPPHIQPLLESFFKKRLETNTNPHNKNVISLEQCLYYFEYFYFIYTNNHPSYRLNTEEKKTFLQMLKVPITPFQLCEPGRITRFEEILQKYRKISDWVSFQLGQYRYQALVELKDRFNYEYQIADSYQSHTLEVMSALSKKRNLGIRVDQTISDAYLNARQITAITDYFNTHYLNTFSDYEKQVTKNLTYHLMQEIQSFFKEKKLSIAQWEQKPIQLPCIPSQDALKDFTDFLNQYLNLPENVEGLNTLIQQDENGEWETLTRPEFNKNLHKLVKIKLIHEKFFFHYSQFLQTSKEIFNSLVLYPKLKLKDYINVQAIIEKDKVQPLQPEKFSLFLKKYQQLVLHQKNVLSLVLDKIKKEPLIIFTFPIDFIRKKTFIENFFPALELYILDALRGNNPLRFEKLLQVLIYLLNLDKAYLEKMLSSQKLLHNQQFALALVEKDGLYLKLFPEIIKNDKAVISLALKNNPLAVFYLSSSEKQNHNDVYTKVFNQLLTKQASFQNKLGLFFASQEEEIEEIIHSGESIHQLQHHEANPDLITAALEKFEAMQEITKLLESEVSLKTMLIATTKISPSLLLKIVKERKAKRLPELPYCENISLLNNFREILNIYITGKEKEKKLSAAISTYLLKNANWFLAFIHYQNYQNLWYIQLWEGIKKSLHLLISFLKGATSFFLGNFIYYFLSWHLPFSTVIFPQSFLLSCISYLITATFIWIKESFPGFDILPSILIVSAIEAAIIMIVAISAPEMLLAFIYQGVFVVILSAKVCVAPFIESFSAQANRWPTLIKELVSHFGKGLSAFILTLKENLYFLGCSLKQKCERLIFHLQLGESDASQQKAEVLTKIWKLIEKEAETSSQPLKNLLNKPYNFCYQGRTYHLSFSQVCAIPIKNTAYFSLEKKEVISIWKQCKSTLPFFRKNHISSTLNASNQSLLDAKELGSDALMLRSSNAESASLPRLGFDGPQLNVG